MKKQMAGGSGFVDCILFVFTGNAFIHNTAILAFFLKCFEVLRWEIGGTDIPEY